MATRKGPKLLQQAAYAKQIGVSKQYIGRLVTTGVLPLTNGLVDPAVADEILAAIRDPSQPLRRKGKAPRDPREVEDDVGDDEGEERSDSKRLPDQLLRARIKHEREKGRLAELQRKRREGELVDAQSVLDAQGERASAERDALLNFASRHSPVMAARLGVTQRQIEDVLDEFIRIHLAERSNFGVAESVDELDDAHSN